MLFSFRKPCGSCCIQSFLPCDSVYALGLFLKCSCICSWHFGKEALFYIVQENDPTLMGRVKKSDAREMQGFYQHYYKKYIQALHNAADKADR
jgi:hypothetical protein